MRLRKTKIVALLFISSVLGSLSTQAQLASSKPGTAFYSPKVKAELVEITAKKSTPQPQVLPSADKKLKDKAKRKIKNPVILAHANAPSSQDPGKKLPSNSKDLKQKGYPKTSP